MFTEHEKLLLRYATCFGLSVGFSLSFLFVVARMPGWMPLLWAVVSFRYFASALSRLIKADGEP